MYSESQTRAYARHKAEMNEQRIEAKKETLSVQRENDCDAFVQVEFFAEILSLMILMLSCLKLQS